MESGKLWMSGGMDFWIVLTCINNGFQPVDFTSKNNRRVLARFFPPLAGQVQVLSVQKIVTKHTKRKCNQNIVLPNLNLSKISKKERGIIMVRNVKEILEGSLEYKYSKNEAIKNFLYNERLYFPGQSVFFVGEQILLTYFALQQLYFSESNHYKAGIYFSTSESGFSLINRLCYAVLDINRFDDKAISPEEEGKISTFREQLKEKELYFSDNNYELDEILNQVYTVENDKKIDFIIIDKINELREYSPENYLFFEKLQTFAQKNSVLIISLIHFNLWNKKFQNHLNFKFAKDFFPATKFADNITLIHPNNLLKEEDQLFNASNEKEIWVLNEIKRSEGGFSLMSFFYNKLSGKFFSFSKGSN